MNADLGVAAPAISRNALPRPLETAATAHSSAAHADLLNALFAEVLHRWTVGLILLDEHSNVLFMNRAAQAMMDAASRPLQALIDDALKPRFAARGGITADGPKALPLTRYGGETACVMLAMPLRGTTSASEAITTVIVIDASRAEARLAAQLASGASLESIAKELGIQKNTVRNQLRAIFQKTRTHRQSELVRLLLMVGLAAVQL